MRRRAAGPSAPDDPTKEFPMPVAHSDPVKPFLIAKDAEGHVRLTLRETRRNSQDYPWVLSTLVEQSFTTPAAAKAYAVEHHGAQIGEFATK
jgi:hypothetical protein